MSTLLTESVVTTKRPCRICRVWFEPDPRAAGRQRVCGKETCRREVHRRECQRWREKHSDYDAERRFKARLLQCGRQVEPSPAKDAEAPEAEKPAVEHGLDRGGVRLLDWSFARESVGLKVAVLVEESTKVMASEARELVLAELALRGVVSRKVLPTHSREETARAVPGP